MLWLFVLVLRQRGSLTLDLVCIPITLILINLDLNHQIAMLELFAAATCEQAAAAAMVLHEPALAWRFCDRALLLHADGQTEIGTTREMLTAERLSALYQHPLQALEYDGRIAFIPQ